MQRCACPCERQAKSAYVLTITAVEAQETISAVDALLTLPPVKVLSKLVARPPLLIAAHTGAKKLLILVVQGMYQYYKCVIRVWVFVRVRKCNENKSR